MVVALYGIIMYNVSTKIGAICSKLEFIVLSIIPKASPLGEVAKIFDFCRRG